jgi:hypothetical protein
MRTSFSEILTTMPSPIRHRAVPAAVNARCGLQMDSYGAYFGASPDTTYRLPEIIREMHFAGWREQKINDQWHWVRPEPKWDDVIKTAKEMAEMSQESEHWYKNNPRFKGVKP